MNPKLLPYALDAASFLLEKSPAGIQQIILFGSVARGEATPESDIDLFVQVTDGNIAGKLQEAKERFYQSVKFLNYWKPKGIDNEIKLTIGNLSSWQDLLPSLVANGVVLYGKFVANVSGKHQEIFVWENISPNKKRVAFNKKIFGYKQQKKLYPGLLRKQGGTRLGKGCIMVDLAAARPIEDLFKKQKVSVKMKKIVSY